MSKNLFCLSRQAITRKHELQTASTNLMPEHGSANASQQGSAYFSLNLWALKDGRGARNLNTWAEWADDVNINACHRTHQRF